MCLTSSGLYSLSFVLGAYCICMTGFTAAYIRWREKKKSKKRHLLKY